MARSKSRPARWAEAVAKAQAARSDLEDAKNVLVEAFGELEELRTEYEEWRGNLPENLEGSDLASKLDEVAGLDFSEEDDIGTMIEQVEAAENAELPRGFGRD